MKSVPVILISYKRAWHTEQVLTALKEHNIKNLFIFSDGPKNKYDLSDVYETRLLFQRIDWTTPTIIERDKNIGLVNSIVSAVNYVFRKFDRVILLEDDCVPQEHFFEFIGTCLDKYEYNEKIFGISGYTVPIPESILKKYPYDLYFFPRIGSWGWATWKRAWQHFEPDLAESYKKAIEDNVDLSQGGDDIPLMLKEMIDGRVKDVWTLHWILTVYLKKGCYIYPTISHIENIGMDGTGIHCGKTDKFLSRIANENPSKFPDNVIIDEGIYQNFRNYYDIPNAIPKIAKKSPKTSNQLKVVHLSTQDFGGAGKAAYRLHKGLQTIGVDSTMLVLNKRSGDSSVKVLPIDYTGSTAISLDVPVYNSPLWMKQLRKWHKLLSNYPKRPAGLEMFTDAESDIRIDLVQEIRDADIINFHWVAGEIDFPGASIAMGNKPVVWTLHDMNPFTGGCHYAGDCLNYKTSCGACPQLGSDTENDLSNHVWKQKYDVYKTLTINIVTPSRWLGKCAAESKLFSPFPVTLIPYGFPIDIFMPYPKAEIRKQLNIPESAKVILFGADSVVNARKGFIYLLEALNRHSLKSIQDSVILTFGSFPEGVKFSSRYPVYNLGRIADENQLALAYSAADVFVIPSLEDNLPNTVVEAMACGVPVVGFNIGGVPDMVDHKKTGFLVRPRDIAGLIEGIDWVISSSDSGTNFSEQCRRKVEKEYALEVQAKAYCELYSGILQDYLPLEEEIRTKAGKLNQQGEDLFKKGDLEGALNAFTRAIEINPNLATARNNLGVLYYNRGEKDKALNQYQQGAQLAPENITFQKNLADFYYVEQGRVEEAMQIYVKVLNTNPEDIETLLALAHICVTLEKFDDARYFFSRILQIEFGNKDAREFLEKLEKCQLSDAGARLDLENDRDKTPDLQKRTLNQQNEDLFTKGDLEGVSGGLALKGENYTGKPAGREKTITLTDTDQPMISVITPSLNQSQFIEQTIKSVLNQGYANFEHIVMDGGSTDGTIEILKKYKHLKWISEKDCGQSEAINKGLAMASGQIFNWLNADDYLEPGALLKIAEAHRQNPNAAGWVGGCRRIGNDGRLINAIFPNHTDRENIGQNWNGRQFYQPACFLNSPIVKAIGGLNSELYCAFDLDLWIRILEYGKFHIGDGIWANALIHSSAKTQASRAKMFEETIAVQNKYGFSKGAKNRYQRVFGNGKLEFIIPQNLRSHMVESQKQYPFPDMIAANEKPIVFISTYLPRFDKASAHNRIFHILKILRSYKIKIIYIYSVETKQDQIYKDHFKDHIDFVYIPLDLAKYYNLISNSDADYLWVTNLWSINYFRFIVQLTDKFGDSRSFKLIADTMDFHFKKYKRKYDYQKNQNDLNVANQFKELETQLYTVADCVIAVSQNEKSDIQSHISGVKSIRVIPNIHQISNDIKSYEKRNHICFVGNFEVNHNVEATRHFIRNIFPLILKHNPDLEFHIIGHNASQYCSEFESPNVKVIGYVDNLESTFDKYKLFVCPMLYGTGMKGKIGAAAAAGLPFVSTAIGTEGFPVSDGVECFIADDPIEFSGKCNHLLNDPISWHNFSIKAWLMIADNYTPGKVAKRLEKIITDFRIGKNRVKGKRLTRIEEGLNLLKSRLNKIGWLSKNELYKQYLEYIEKNEATAAPDVSIIVISWRYHPDTIHNFETLTKQSDTNFELIFVDNGGTLGEFHMLKPYIDTYVKLNTNTGAYLARNVGSLFANAPILLFLEDDGIPANNLIKAHLYTFAKYDVIAVRGVYKAKSDDNPLNKLANHYYLGDLPFPRYSDLEGNSAYDSKIFFKAGGWDDEIYFGGGGIDLAIRLMRLEPDMRKQIYSPEPVIFHDYATDGEHLKKKREKQIESFERLRRKHQIFDSFHRAWARFIGHHELIPRRMTQSGRGVTDISTQKSTLLDDIYSCYQLGDMQQTAKLLGEYQQSLKQGI